MLKLKSQLKKQTYYIEEETNCLLNKHMHPKSKEGDSILVNGSYEDMKQKENPLRSKFLKYVDKSLSHKRSTTRVPSLTSSRFLDSRNNSKDSYLKEKSINNVSVEHLLNENKRLTHNKSFHNIERSNGKSCVNIKPISYATYVRNIQSMCKKKIPACILLYENNKLIQTKLELKRKQGELNLKTKQTPMITNKAKSIERDPEYFGERLYPYHKVSKSRNAQRDNKIFGLSGYNPSLSSKIYRRPTKSVEIVSHIPTIDKISKRIAENLNSSSLERLTMRVTRKKLSTNTSTNSISMRSTKSLNHFHDLYERGVSTMRSKLERYADKKKNQQECYKNFPYRPMTNKKTRHNSSDTSKSPKQEQSSVLEYLKNSKLDLYSRNKSWKNIIETRNDKAKKAKEKSIEQACTFRPNTSMSNLNMSQISSVETSKENLLYIYRRRQSLLKENENKLYAQSKFPTGDKYIMKKTIVKEFNFSISQSRKCKTNKFSPKILHNIKSLNDTRKNLQTESFFLCNDDQSSQMDESSLDGNFDLAVNRLSKRMTNFKLSNI